MQISKQETERLLKAAQSNKITAETLRKNDTQQNKRQELMRLQRMVETKILLGEEITVVVVETN
ncbi:MAG: hypothetical protein ISP88_14445 [Pseudomonadales bacterium]|nr:hypothetical protein [Pseudomonadales bacterium]|tara:strand:- start:185 stop:376 length:192 start_codon:yes stop_codon:yes gene_type:complete